MFAASYAVQEDQRARERLIVQRHARRQREAGENGNWSQKESGPFLGGGGQPSVDLQKDGASGQLLDGRALRSAGPQGHPMSFGPPRVLISLQGQVAPCPDGAVVGCTSTHRYKRNTGRGKGGIGFRVTRGGSESRFGVSETYPESRTFPSKSLEVPSKVRCFLNQTNADSGAFAAFRLATIYLPKLLLLKWGVVKNSNLYQSQVICRIF
jgi:hypothetical protein